ncbi:MAG: transposase [Planctomycetaceae bacterium]
MPLGELPGQSQVRCGHGRRASYAAVQRQHNGNRGKIDNGVNSVALSYSAPGFDCQLETRLDLPQEWADDPERRKETITRTVKNDTS